MKHDQSDEYLDCTTSYDQWNGTQYRYFIEAYLADYKDTKTLYVLAVTEKLYFSLCNMQAFIS